MLIPSLDGSRLSGLCEPVTSLPASARPDLPTDVPPPAVDAFTLTRAVSEGSVAAHCVVGNPVSEDLVASIATLEAALQEARTARESAERRLRLQRDRVDDDLAAALAACRSLEKEKLAALGFMDESDAAFFLDEPLHLSATLTLASLHEKHRAQIGSLTSDHAAQLEDQKLELSKRYLAEVQDFAIASARSVEHQAQQWRARDAERAAEVEVLQRGIAAGNAALEAFRQDASIRLVEDAALRQEVATLASDLHGARSELAAAHTRIHLLLSSTSWRASRPLRGGRRVLRWVLGR